MTVADLCRKHAIGKATFFKWKARFGGVGVSDARKLKALEDENVKLKKLLAPLAVCSQTAAGQQDAMLDNLMLKDITQKNGNARC